MRPPARPREELGMVDKPAVHRAAIDAEPASEPGLNRSLRLPSAIALVVGGTIGTSIFIIPSAVAARAGSPGWALAAWIVAGLLSAISALCLAELAAAIPATGGSYAYLKRAFPGELVPFSFAWMMCFAYGPGAMAVVASMSAGFVSPYIQTSLGLEAAPTRHVAVALLAAVTVVNILGVRIGGWIQTALTVGKCLLMALMIMVALLFISPDIGRLGLVSAQGSGASASGFTSALLLCLFSFSGAHFVTLVAGEVKQPGRSIPISIFTGFGLVTVLYLTLNVAIFVALPFAEVIGSEKIAFDLMEKGLGPVGGLIATATVFTSGVAVLNAQCLGYPRILFSLAEDDLFFSGPALVNPLTRTPAIAIVVLGLLSGVYLFSGTYSDILGYAAFVSQLFVMLMVASVIVLRRREPGLVRPYKVWGYPWTPLIFIVAMGTYLVSLLVTKAATVVVGVIIVAAGVPVYLHFKRRRAPAMGSPVNAALGALTDPQK